MSRVACVFLLRYYVQTIPISGSVRLTYRKLDVPINKRFKYLQEQENHNVIRLWGQKPDSYITSWNESYDCKWEYTGMFFWSVAIHNNMSNLVVKTNHWEFRSTYMNSRLTIQYEQLTVAISVNLFAREVQLTVRNRFSTPEWSEYEFVCDLPEDDIIERTLYMLQKLNYFNDYLPSWADRMI